MGQPQAGRTAGEPYGSSRCLRIPGLERFDIFRRDLSTASAFSAAAGHLPFALGRHFCVGALRAKAEAEIGSTSCSTRFAGPPLPDGFAPVEEGVLTRGPKSLPVLFTPAA